MIGESLLTIRVKVNYTINVNMTDADEFRTFKFSKHKRSNSIAGKLSGKRRDKYLPRAGEKGLFRMSGGNFNQLMFIQTITADAECCLI